MKKAFLFSLAATLTCSMCFSKVWRVNSTPGVNANFATAAAALASGSVVNGDSLYFEGSSVDYGSVTIDKQLTILGTGYFLSGLQLQYNLNAAYISTVIVKVPNVKIYGVKIGSFSIYGPEYSGTATNIVINRCYIDNIYLYGTQNNIFIVQNYLTGQINSAGYPVTSLLVSNNIIGGGYIGGAPDVGVIEYNVFGFYFYASHSITLSNGTYSFRNNIIRNGNSAATITGATNSSFAYNMAEGAILPPGNGNQNSVNMSGTNVFLDGSDNIDINTSIDSRYQLSVSSPAKTAGAGNTPIGAFGGGSPYRLNGLPAIPAIYDISVQSAIATGTIVPVTFSSRSNN